MGNKYRLDTLPFLAINEYGFSLRRARRRDHGRLATRVVLRGTLVVCRVVMPHGFRGGEVRCNDRRKREVEELEIFRLYRERCDPLQLGVIEVKYANIPIRGTCIQS